MKPAPSLFLLAALVACWPAVAAAQSPRQAGDALRARLRTAGLDKRLAGEVKLTGRLDASRAVGTLRLRTDLVVRDEVPVYRIQDRLTLSLPGLGSASLFVRADLRADLSPVEVVLESEEPRGRGTVATTRLELRREKDRWVRYASVGNATPTRTPLPKLPADALVLTPPLGAGERLVRLLEPRLGLRLSLRALDLESGQPASFKASIDDQQTLSYREGKRGPSDGFLVRRREAAADLEATLAGRGRLVRLRQRRRARLQFQAAELARVVPDPSSPVGVVRLLLGAIARADAKQIEACLDLPALHTAAGKVGTQEAFARVLLARLADDEWLRSQGLDLPAKGSGAADFTTQEVKGGALEVTTVGAKTSGFVLKKTGERWRVVRLPAAKRKR